MEISRNRSPLGAMLLPNHLMKILSLLQCQMILTSVSETLVGGRDLDRKSVSLMSSLTISVIIAANSMNRRPGLCEAAVGMAEESGSRQPPIPHDHRPQGNDHPAPRTPVRTGHLRPGHCGGNPPGPSPWRPYQAGTVIARVGAPHSHPAQEDLRDLLTGSPGHLNWAVNRATNAIVTVEPREWKLACVVGTAGRWKRVNSTAGNSLRAAPLVAARTVTGCLDRG